MLYFISNIISPPHLVSIDTILLILGYKLHMSKMYVIMLELNS